MPGSRIAVEITANSAELQAAIAKASTALKDLSKVVADTAAASARNGEAITKTNQKVAASFGAVGTAAGEMATKTKVATGEMATAAEAGATRVAASAKKIETGFGAAHSSITNAGRNITLALAGVAAGGLYMAAKFQQATTQFNTQAGASLQQTEKLKKGILDMAASVGATPNQLADGMYHVVSSLNNLIPAAKRVHTELGVLKVAAEGAAIGNSSIKDTTYALSGAMNAMSQTTIPQAKKTMAELNAIVGAGDMHMQDLVNAMSTGILPAARNFGIGLQSVGAALAVLTDSGIPAEQAATRLRMAITLMGAPTKMATKILEDLGMQSQTAISTSARMSDLLLKAGVSTTTMAADLRQPDGILVALDDLKTHLEKSGVSAEGASAVIARAFGGARSGVGIDALIQNLEKLRGKFTTIGQTTDNFGQAWKTTQDTLIFKWHQVEGAVQSFLIKIGTGLMPVVSTAIGALQGMVNWLGQNKAAAEVLGGAIGTLGAVAIASFVTNRAVAFVRSVGNMLGALQKFARWLLTGQIEKNMATAMAGTEAAVTSATPVLEADGVAAGSAVGKGMLSGVARIFTAAALTYLVAEALKGPLHNLSSTIHNALGSGFGSGINVKSGLNLTPGQAHAQANQDAAKMRSMGINDYTAAQFYQALVKAGDVVGQGPRAVAPTGGTVGGVNQGMLGLANVTRWTSLVTAASKKYGIPVPILLAQIDQESGGNPNSVSPAGAFGLTQFMPGTAQTYGVTMGSSPAAVKSQTLGQAHYLSDLVKQYGSITKALEAYYGGSRGVANPNEYVPGGPTPAQYAAQILAKSSEYVPQGTGYQPNASTGGSYVWSSNGATPGGTTGGSATNTTQGQQGSGFYDWTSGTFVAATSAQQAAIRAEWSKAYPGSPYPAGPSQQAAEIKKRNQTVAAKQAKKQIYINPLTGNVETVTAATYRAQSIEERTRKLNQAEGLYGSAAIRGVGSVGTGVIAGMNAAVLAEGVAQTQNAANQGFFDYKRVVARQKLLTGLGKTGSGILGGLQDAVQSGSLSSLTTVLNMTHEKALGSFVEKAVGTHDKHLTNLADRVEAVAQKAENLRTSMYAASTLTGRGAHLANLYNAGVALGINTPAQGVNAQEMTYAGLTGGALTGALGQLIPALEGGNLSAAQYAQFAQMFGGNGSALGADLMALSQNPNDPTLLDAVDNLLGTLVGLTQATQANTAAQQDNTATLLSLYQQQNTYLSEQVRLGAVQTNVIAGMIPQIPHYAAGGPVVDDGLIYAHKGEYVMNRSQVAAAGNGWGQPPDVHTHVHVSGDIAPLLQVIDARVRHPENVRMVSQMVGQRTTQLRNAPGGYRGYGV